MKMLKLSSECVVDPESVESIHIDRQGLSDERYHRVAVTMKSGAVHLIEPGYGISIHQAHNRVLGKIMEALGE